MQKEIQIDDLVKVTLFSPKRENVLAKVVAITTSMIHMGGNVYQLKQFEVRREDNGRHELATSAYVRLLGPKWAEDLLEELVQYAKEHYEEGWSFLVECDERDLLEKILESDLRELEKALKRYTPLAEAFHSKFMEQKALRDECV